MSEPADTRNWALEHPVLNGAESHACDCGRGSSVEKYGVDCLLLFLYIWENTLLGFWQICWIFGTLAINI